ncbi:MAG: hypothetical protein H7X70_04300 [Candidatus Kapabacteria bacterium]|nr:hypothetical protein [Candidatus Kapabacteria bacterium]
MKISNLLRVSLLVMSTLIVRVESLHSQSIELTPAWTVTNTVGTLVKVADSVVVIATKDSVYVYEAFTGTLRYAWQSQAVIDGLALEQHRDGIVLSTLQRLGGKNIASFSFYTYEGSLIETDSFELPRINSYGQASQLKINAVSPSGRYIVYGSNAIYDRVTRGSMLLIGYPVKRVSFSLDESVCAIKIGITLQKRGTYDRIGDTYLYSLGSSESGGIVLQAKPIDDEAQFIPGTNYLWNFREILSMPDQKIVRTTLQRPYGRLCSDGVRFIYYDLQQSFRYGAIIDGFENFIKYKLPDTESNDPLYFESQWYETTDDLNVVALLGNPVRVYRIPATTRRTALDPIYLPQKYYEHTPLYLNNSYTPVTANCNVTFLVDGEKMTSNFLFLATGQYQFRVELRENDSLIDALDSTIEVLPRKKSEYTIWIGEGSKTSYADISPSGDRIAISGDESYIVDVDRDTLFIAKKKDPTSEIRYTMRFISNRTCLFLSQFDLSGGGYGGLPNWLQVSRYCRTLNLENGTQQSHGLTRITYFTSGTTPDSPIFSEVIDRTHGRGIFYAGGGALYSGAEMSFVVTDTSIGDETPCMFIPKYIAIDPSRDSPLCIDRLTSASKLEDHVAWRIDGQTRVCQEVVDLPLEPMTFVQEGRYLWSRSGVYDGRTGRQLVKTLLPSLCVAVPHTSLVACSVMDTNGWYNDLTFYTALDTLAIYRLPFGSTIAEIVCDTAGNRLLIKHANPAVVEVLDLKKIINENGLDQFRIVPTTEIQNETSQRQNDAFPNPSSSFVYLKCTAVDEYSQIEVVDQLGAIMGIFTVEIDVTELKWDLRMLNGLVALKGMYGFRQRTRDGHIIGSGTFIISH